MVLLRWWEYSYLVKKVVFKIDILPVVKVLSALFVHVFFIFFVVVVYALNGYMPTAYTLQVFTIILSDLPGNRYGVFYQRDHGFFSEI